jgi:hypothetical protein
MKAQMTKAINILLMIVCFSSCIKLEEDNYQTGGEFHSLYLKHSFIIGLDGFIIGDYKILSKHKVKGLQVLECSGTSCQGSSYKFDKYGNMIYSAPSYNLSYSKYKYDKYHLLEEEKAWFQDEYEYKKIYAYYRDSVVAKVIDSDNKVVSKAQVCNPNYIHDIEYLDFKHILKQVKYDMIFPCGEEFLGENEILFEYGKKGLISQVSIYNLTTKKIKSFDFTYEY